MNNVRSHSLVSDTYRKKLKQNIFNSIASNLRSNITIARGNLDILDEQMTSRLKNESLRDLQYALTNLENLAKQIDSLGGIIIPDFVPRNVDLVKILGVVTNNLKFMAVQRESTSSS